VWPDGSEEHVTFIFRVEEYAKQETGMTQVTRSFSFFEMSVDFQQITRRYVPEDRTLQESAYCIARQ
jgi:hypothetical protein